MKPTHIYVESILKLLLKEEIKGMVHVTGGGFYENIPRILKKDQTARIIKKNYQKVMCLIESERSLS